MYIYVYSEIQTDERQSTVYFVLKACRETVGLFVKNLLLHALVVYKCNVLLHSLPASSCVQQV